MSTSMLHHLVTPSCLISFFFFLFVSLFVFMISLVVDWREHEQLVGFYFFVEGRP